MPTPPYDGQIVATIILNKKGRAEVLQGDQGATHTLHIHITQGMLLKMNGFVRDKQNE